MPGVILPYQSEPIYVFNFYHFICSSTELFVLMNNVR